MSDWVDIVDIASNPEDTVSAQQLFVKRLIDTPGSSFAPVTKSNFERQPLKASRPSLIVAVPEAFFLNALFFLRLP